MMNFLRGIPVTWFLLVSVEVDRIDCEDCMSCGKRPLFPKPMTNRIIGGRRAKKAEIPWQVFVRFVHFDRRTQQCGGSIIHEWWVLTAAHCVRNKRITGYDVVSGIVDLKDGNMWILERTSNVQLIGVARIVAHDLNSTTLENDIALIELAAPIRFDDYSQPVCLPRASDDFTGRVCRVSGWGNTKPGRNQSTNRFLKTVSLPLIPFDDCNRLHKELDPDVTVAKNSICTLFPQGGRDACDGDSGGPLVCTTEDGLFRQVGVTSWGDVCGGSRSPGVYTDVAKYLPWIREVTGLDFE